jgi:hypothetical protein
MVNSKLLQKNSVTLVKDGFALSREDGEQINFRDTRMLIKVFNDDSDGRYSLIETTYPPNLGSVLTART